MQTYLPSRGRVVVERCRVGEAIAFTVAHDAEPVVAGERPLEDAQRRAVQRGVDHDPAPAACVARVQRGGRRVRGEDAGEVVGDRDADAYRWSVRIAGEVQQTAVADPDPIEARSRGVRPVLSEHRDAHGDEARVARGGADVPLLQRARAKVLDDDVGGGGQAPVEVLAFGCAQIERDALAAAPFDGPEE